MTGLLAHLRRRIRRHGPLGVAEFMTDALIHPEFGYYATNDPFGVSGDFVTAPEVSQMFGELIGLWCAVTWRQMGEPEKVKLVELGPGRGTLIADALHAGRQMDGFIDAVSVHLVEASAKLQKRQHRNLKDLAVDFTWHQDLGGVGNGPMIVIANEFFDALPIRQFERTSAGWCEKLVGLDNGGGGLAWMLSSPDPAIHYTIPEAHHQAPKGAIVEVSQARTNMISHIADAIGVAGGAALIIDYGPVKSATGDSLQAVKDHRYHQVLADVGDADLTSHVDFAELALNAEASGATVFGPVSQGEFLRSLGIEIRAKQLAADKSPRQTGEILAALKRLIDDSEMGSLFKVLAIAHPDQPRPEGFPAKDGANSSDLT